MIVSTNWLKDIISYTSSPKELEDGLTSLGLECTYKKSVSAYSDILVGKILSVNKIKGSDHLNLCSVDLGENEKEIVCGAENVKAGILVPVALPGAYLDYGRFKIKKVKIRGVLSDGMICSEKELAISDNHEGIMILNNRYKVGDKFSESIENSDFLDIDLTPNRGDCLSHLGVAREISILENKKINKANPTFSCSAVISKIKIKINNKGACPRYAARVIKGVKVGESPNWLKNKLLSIGQKSINNIVDAANYVLFDLGHPMHTFDLNQISNSTIIVKKSDKKQRLLCLDGAEREITKDHLLICDDKKPLAIAGIIGLQNSSVTNNTTDIVIESACFNPVSVRKGAKLLDLSTDASKRFERGTDINSILHSLDTLAALIQKTAGGKICKDLIDIYPKERLNNEVNFNTDDCNSLLGTSISKQEILKILKKLSINTKVDKKNIKCLVPSYRNDLERSVDLYEEIARVYGYDNIDSTDSFNSSFSIIQHDANKIKKYLSNILSMNGFNEHYSNSLFSEKENSLFSKNRDVEIANPLSSDMKYLRNSIIPGLINAVAFNINHNNKNFKLFEIGSIHKKITTKNGNRYIEENSLGLSWCYLTKKDWKDKSIFDIFDVKGEIAYIFNLLGIPMEFKYKDNLLCILSNKKKIGYLTTIKDINSKSLKNNPNVYFAEFQIDILDSLYGQIMKKNKISMPSQYPTIERDISILISKNITYKDITDNISESAGLLLQEISLFDLYVDKDIDNDKHSLSLSLLFSSKDRTLKDAEIDTLMITILKNLKNKFQIIQR